MSVTREMVVKFGSGDIGVGAVHRPGETRDIGVVFWEQEPRPAGPGDPEAIGKSTDELPAFLRFEFTNAESVRAVMSQLKRVEKSLEAM